MVDGYIRPYIYYICNVCTGINWESGEIVNEQRIRSPAWVGLKKFDDNRMLNIIHDLLPCHFQILIKISMDPERIYRINHELPLVI